MNLAVKPAGQTRCRSVLRCAAWVILPMALTKGQLGALYAPWALAAVAVAGEGLSGLCALLGAAAGGWLFFPFQGALRHTACAVLIYAALLTFADSRLYLRVWFRPMVCAAMLFLVQSVTLIGCGFSRWMLCIAAAAVAAAAAYQGLQGGSHTRTAWLILGFCAALLPLEIDGFSPGILGGAWLTLMLAGGSEPAYAAAIGAGIGLVLDLVPARPSLLLAAGFGLGAYLAAQFEKPWWRGASFCLIGLAAAVLFDADNLPRLGLELALGAVGYLCVPRRFLLSRTDKPAEAGHSSPLRQAAGAFRELYESFFHQSAPEKPENPSVLFDRAAEQVCKGCVLQSRCWQTHYNDTYDAFNNACPHLLRRGRALAQDFPQTFSCQCIHFEPLLDAINRELYAYLLRRQYRLRLSGVKELAAAQYAQVGEALASSVEVTAVPLTQLMQLRSTWLLRPKESEKLCGDQAAQLSVGMSDYFLLCDGMGSGEAAHAEAAMTIRLLGQFLRAGIDPVPALKTLNTAMRLQQNDQGAFPAVDLLAIRKDTGRASLYKYGAAASYLKHHGSVTRYVSCSLPVGLQETEEPPAVQTLVLHPGDTVVLVSDGVVIAGDEWLQDLLAGWSGDVRALADQILHQSEQHGGKQDDCAVIAVQVENMPTNGSQRV